MFENLTRRFSDIVSTIRGRKMTEANVRESLRDIRRALLEADASLPVVKDFEKRVLEKALGSDVIEGVTSGQQLVKIFHEELVNLMGPVDPEVNWVTGRPTVILMSGLQGSGKTTTCGKLARMFSKRMGRKPMLVAADLQRPAAIEQLKVLGKQLNFPVFHEPGLTPPDLCDKAVKEAESRGCDTVILDTAGRLQIDDEMMAELKLVAKHTKPDEIFLVCDSMTGQDAVNSAKGFNEALELTGVILTKLDGDARGGAALSVKAITGKPIKFIGVGEHLDRIDEFDPERMASRILGMGDIVGLVNRAQDEIDEKEQAEMEAKLQENSFDLNDFLKQLSMIKKMGSLRDLLGHIPGLGGKVDQLQLKGDELVVTESIIQSMTMTERKRPEIINTSRRTRIAKGCGRGVQEVNMLLKQFKGMKDMMGALTGGGGMGGMMGGGGGGGGMMSKLKGLNQMRKQLGSMGDHMGTDSVNTLMHQTQSDGLENLTPDMIPTVKGGGAAGPSKKDIQKKRKAERQRKRKQRKKK